MSNRPKAKWQRVEPEQWWSAIVGTYRLEANTREGWWDAYARDESWGVEGNCGTPCDVVTLMLAAESALETHLRSVADTMTWPEAPIAEPQPYASITLGAWNTRYTDLLLPVKDQPDVTNRGQTEIYVGGVKLAPGETLRTINAYTARSWHTFPAKCTCLVCLAFAGDK